jgi:hypothetical protein
MALNHRLGGTVSIIRGIIAYLDTHLPKVESHDADTKAHGLSVQHTDRSEEGILLSMNPVSLHLNGVCSNGGGQETLHANYVQCDKFKITYVEVATKSMEHNCILKVGGVA